MNDGKTEQTNILIILLRINTVHQIVITKIGKGTAKEEQTWKHHAP